MKPLPARAVAEALRRKGFRVSTGDHKFFHFIHDGKDVGISTKVSHGSKEIDVGLAVKMRKQMKLASNSDFVRFIECAMSQADYEDHLRSSGILPPLI